MEEKRYLAFDFGLRRVGVAISDPFGSLARPLETLVVKGRRDAIKQALKIIDEYQPVAIVVGRPVNLSGDASEIQVEADFFTAELKKRCGIPVYTEDERLTSRQAEAILHAQGKKIKGHKENIDRIAAALILQSFLDRRDRTGS